MALHDNCYWSSFLQLFSGIQYAAENCFWREPVLNNWSIIVFPWQMSELFGGLEDRNLSARRFIGIRFVSQPATQSVILAASKMQPRAEGAREWVRGGARASRIIQYSAPAWVLVSLAPRARPHPGRNKFCIALPAEREFCAWVVRVAPKKAALRAFKDEFELLRVRLPLVCVPKIYTFLFCVGNSGKGAHSFISFPALHYVRARKKMESGRFSQINSQVRVAALSGKIATASFAIEKTATCDVCDN